MKRPNADLGGRPPLSRMLHGNVQDILFVRNYWTALAKGARRSPSRPLSASSGTRWRIFRSYGGPGAAIVMGYGVLYTADAFMVAMRESGHHAGRYLSAASITDPAVIPRYAVALLLDDSDHLDIRRGGTQHVHQQAIYDPKGYSAAQVLGARLRDDGHDGLWYDSVRSPGGTCYATFRPLRSRTRRTAFDRSSCLGTATQSRSIAMCERTRFRRAGQAMTGLEPRRFV